MRIYCPDHDLVVTRLRRMETLLYVLLGVAMGTGLLSAGQYI